KPEESFIFTSHLRDWRIEVWPSRLRDICRFALQMSLDLKHYGFQRDGKKKVLLERLRQQERANPLQCGCLDCHTPFRYSLRFLEPNRYLTILNSGPVQPRSFRVVGPDILLAQQDWLLFKRSESPQRIARRDRFRRLAFEISK